jgi:hypothetical protein
MNLLQLFRTEVFTGCDTIIGFLERQDHFGELYLYCLGVTVLRVLDQEHHQRRDDGRAGIDDPVARRR